MECLQPSCREGFEIGIICALPLEYDAVCLVLDEFWDEQGDPYGRAAGDQNNYTTGRIGKHNVVIALLSQMGKASATSAAHSMRVSYSGLRLVLLVGICGGVPFIGDKEVLLGDVIISKAVVQYDFGRRYPGEFSRKDTRESKPSKEIQNLLITLEASSCQRRVHRRAAAFLGELQARAMQWKMEGRYDYPGIAEDRLFESDYTHHHVCGDRHLPCDKVACDKRYLVTRKRLSGPNVHEPFIHIGCVASGDTVMKSGEDRDRIAKEEEVIGFEMEAAGIIEEFPNSVVVKGVCDYADSHKNKNWQDFAAATASCTMKALLERFIPEEKTIPRITNGCAESSLLAMMSQFAQIMPPQIGPAEHVTPGQVLDMTMTFRRRDVSSTQCPSCHFENAGNSESQVTCGVCRLVYRRVEEVREILVSEDIPSQPETEIRKEEHNHTVPLQKQAVPKTDVDGDDIHHYSRVQVIDTNLQISKADMNKIINSLATLDVRDLDDAERIAAHLANVYGLSRTDCLLALNECESQLQAVKAEIQKRKFDRKSVEQLLL
ncbi:hypothetical protein ASPWEDRAFT_30878 [Aspergillus wentii DTO 134E9]|uniref:Nucleoside phosphorylase domain-containing protein n=1 Tax=Aspergillus wentii DTO 134E9 TaxID=1073089 RepID=A0A1L9RAK1_ASPWE|nr:uncharacterized protein ASPWEDRAFT_30878 [Aspergillus wentii DTO 134E9]OJJ31928.1 hypothetical protein ASPWEDRAFT_30878 [Aspergillus wentii DTO 134E9]